jgi:hypothetical protein
VPDQLEKLFTDLRAGVLPEVRPPGTAAARHTVRRRRTTRTVVAAATAALAVTGGVVAINLPRTPERQESPADLTGSARLALDSQLPKLTGRLRTGAVEAEGRLTFPDLAAGGYTLAVTCAGAGSVRIDAELVRSAEETAVLGGQIVSCAHDALVSVMTFRLPDRGPVVITAEGDGSAAGHSAYALELGDGDGSGDYQPEGALYDPDAVPSDESSWNAGRATAVFPQGGAGAPVQVTTEQLRGEEATGYSRTGDFELQVVCSGPGNLTMTVGAVPPGGDLTADSQALVTAEVPCNVDPATSLNDILSLPKGTTLLIVTVPDQAAWNRAGWAYRVTPV